MPMDNQEKLQHELIKNIFKMLVMNNPKLTSQQKQYAVYKLDEASRNADWLYDMMKQCGYIR